MTPSDRTASTLLDRTAALARAGGDPELLREIGSLFRDEYPRMLKELSEAMASGDAPAAGRAAHGLKGSAANFGAAPAVEAALKIEQLARENRIAEAHNWFSALERDLAKLAAELKQI